MRYVDHRLNRPLEQPRLDFVEEQRQKDRRGEREHDAVKGQKQGVYHECAEVAGVEEGDKVLHANPGARVKAPEDVVILKPNQNAPHGEIPEEEKVNDARNAHDVQPVAFAHRFQCFT